MMWYMHEECAKAVESKNLKNFTTTMNKLMVGFKVDDEELFPDPVHVNDALRMVGKTLPDYFRWYEILCEFAHPNWSGTMACSLIPEVRSLKLSLVVISGARMR